MLSSMSSGMSSSSERIALASLASRASRLRLLKSMKSMLLGDEERLDADVTLEAIECESESEYLVLFEEVAIEEVSTSMILLSLWSAIVFTWKVRTYFWRWIEKSVCVKKKLSKRGKCSDYILLKRI